MQKIPFFAENGDCKYVVLNFFLYIHVNRLEEIYEKVSFGQMEKILFPIFEKFGNNTFVNMFFFNLMNIYRLNFLKLNNSKKEN